MLQFLHMPNAVSLLKVSSIDVCVLIQEYYAIATCLSHSLTSFGNQSVTPSLHLVHTSRPFSKRNMIFFAISVPIPCMRDSDGVKLPIFTWVLLGQTFVEKPVFIYKSCSVLQDTLFELLYKILGHQLHFHIKEGVHSMPSNFKSPCQ